MKIALVIMILLICGLIAACYVGGCCMQPKGPFCQSCAMPMDKPELCGTKADGSKSQDYCVYCYQKGQFTEPDISMEKMIDKCVGQMVDKKIMSEKKARKLMVQYLPPLKRWKDNQ